MVTSMDGQIPIEIQYRSLSPEKNIADTPSATELMGVQCSINRHTAPLNRHGSISSYPTNIPPNLHVYFTDMKQKVKGNRI